MTKRIKFNTSLGLLPIHNLPAGRLRQSFGDGAQAGSQFTSKENRPTYSKNILIV
jgi:hypothetical protein